MKPNSDIQKELEDFSPFLADLHQKEEGFQVPKDYFNGLTDSILAKCQEEKQTIALPKIGLAEKLQIFINSWFTPQYAVGFASVLILIVGSSLFFNQKPDAKVLYADISTNDIELYVFENLDDFEVELFEENLQVTSSQYDVLNDIDVEDLESYFEEQAIDDLEETTIDDLF